MKTSIVVVFFLAVLTVKSQEVALPWDSAGRVYVLTAEMESKMLLFPDVQNLMEARLFRTDDTTYSVEIFYKFGDEVRRERRPLTPIELNDLKEKFKDRALISMPSAAYNHDGRSALLWGSALWSFFYYAPMIVVTINPDEGNVASALPFIITPILGYFIPSALTANTDVTDGTASLALGGMFQGAIHGWALGALIQGDKMDEQFGAGLSVVAGITETIVGFTVAKSSGMTEGHAGMINTTAFYGSLSGLFTGFVFGSTESEIEMSARAAGAAGLVGAAAGIVVGNALGSTGTFTSSDAGLYAIDGFLGATLPLALLSALEPEDLDPRIFFGSAVLSTAAGLYVGTAMVAGRDYNSTLGPILSTIGGGLLGFGVGILIGDRAPAYLWWVGAAAGFGISYATSDWKPESRNSDRSSLNIQINPLAIASLSMPELSKITMPVASLSYRW